MTHPRILVLETAPDLVAQVREASGTLRPRPEVIGSDHLVAAEETVVAQGPFDLVVAGPGLATKAGFARLAAIHDNDPALSVVLAFNTQPDAPMRDVVRTGAMDLIQLPVLDRSMTASLERALAARRTRTLPTAQADGLDQRAPGRVFTVASATGGCGKTFYATNLAYFLHTNTRKPTCIVDLDLQFGEVSTALRLRPENTIADALSGADPDGTEGPDGSRIPDSGVAELADIIDSSLVRHESGVYVLAAPKDPSDADRIHPSDVSRVIEAVRRRFDYVVVDTPSALTEIVLAAFDLSDQLFVLGTLDLPSVRNMSLFLSTLDKLKIPSDDVSLILNKAEPDVGITVSEVEALYSQGFSSVLPYSREVSKSVNLGSPILGSAPRSEVGVRMATGMVGLLPKSARPLPVVHQSTPIPQGRLARFFRPILHPAGI